MDREIGNYCNTCPSSLRGMCCWFSFYDGLDNFLIYPCKYLSEKTKRCTIYKKRFKINKKCVELDEAYMMGGLPESCPYVEDYDFEPTLPFKTVNIKKRNKLIEMIKNGIEKGRFHASNSSERSEGISP